MSEPVIVKKGSYMIEVEEGKSYYWCSCGLSKKQPFCDSSHKGTGFKSVPYKATANKKVFFCGCKRTKNQPFCDSTHKQLL